MNHLKIVPTQGAQNRTARQADNYAGEAAVNAGGNSQCSGVFLPGHSTIPTRSRLQDAACQDLPDQRERPASPASTESPEHQECQACPASRPSRLASQSPSHRASRAPPDLQDPPDPQDPPVR